MGNTYMRYSVMRSAVMLFIIKEKLFPGDSHRSHRSRVDGDKYSVLKTEALKPAAGRPDCAGRCTSGSCAVN